MVADLSLDKEALKAVIQKPDGACECEAGHGVRDNRVPVQRPFPTLRWRTRCCGKIILAG
jgi:hypothetical protein